MKYNIQNIFMDLKSYELIQNITALDELVSFIQNNINILDVQPISIKGVLFEVEYRPNKPFLSFIYTVQGYHTIDLYKNNFRENVYLYNQDALASYEGDFCGSELLLYTKNPTLWVIPYKESGLSKMDSATGELIQRF